jgi:hypothetical protein
MGMMVERWEGGVLCFGFQLSAPVLKRGRGESSPSDRSRVVGFQFNHEEVDHIHFISFVLLSALSF